MKKKKRSYSILNNMIFLIKDMWRTYPLLVVYLIIQVVFSVVLPVLTMLLPKITLELVLARAEAGKIVAVLGGLGLTIAVLMALTKMAEQGRYMMYNSMRNHYQIRLFKQSLSCDYDFIEKAEGQKMYMRAYDPLTNGDNSSVSRMTVAMVDITICIVSFVIYSGIISYLNPVVLVILVVLSSINYFAMKYAQNYQHRTRDENANLQNKLWYVQTAMNGIDSGKDIRLYGMENWFSNMWNNIQDGITAWRQRVRNRAFMSDAVSGLTLFLRDSIAYGYLIWAVLSSVISIGDFVLFFSAVTGFSGFVSRFGRNLNFLQAASLSMCDMRHFLERTDTPDPEKPVDIHLLKDLTIEFCHVTFGYDEDSDPVLCDISFTIKPGEKLALVGINGAGKTTITKLMCGFYQPQKGEIRIGGVDIKCFRKEDLFSIYAAVFQEVYIPPFCVAENVSLKPLEETDMERVELCLKEAGLYEKIMEYPKGCYELMGREIEEGIMLSGGQKQKLLMARALYKDAPVLILDEPTAALDPIAESETYELFWKLSKNKTAIFISHRLASTRFCDRILLLGEGRLLEVGTHEELLEKNGRYAEMFEIQSQYYKEEAENE